MQQATTQALDGSLRSRFPGQIADVIPLPSPVDSPELQLEGSIMEVAETGHTDTLDTTALHVPDLGLIVAGDVAYDHCHMYVGDTTADSRAEWMAALDRLAALNPTAVVTAHKDPTALSSGTASTRSNAPPRCRRLSAFRRARARVGFPVGIGS